MPLLFFEEEERVEKASSVLCWSKRLRTGQKPGVSKVKEMEANFKVRTLSGL